MVPLAKSHLYSGKSEGGMEGTCHSPPPPQIYIYTKPRYSNRAVSQVL